VNQDALKFLAWLAVGTWAVISTVVANLPTGSYLIVGTSLDVPPQVGAQTFSGRCLDHDTAVGWTILTTEPDRSAPYMRLPDPLKDGDIQVGYKMYVMNAAGVQQPTARFTLQLTCQKAHTPVVEWLSRLVGIKAKASGLAPSAQ